MLFSTKTICIKCSRSDARCSLILPPCGFVFAFAYFHLFLRFFFLAIRYRCVCACVEARLIMFLCTFNVPKVYYIQLKQHKFSIEWTRYFVHAGVCMTMVLKKKRTIFPHSHFSYLHCSAFIRSRLNFNLLSSQHSVTLFYSFAHSLRSYFFILFSFSAVKSLLSRVSVWF